MLLRHYGGLVWKSIYGSALNKQNTYQRKLATISSSLLCDNMELFSFKLLWLENKMILIKLLVAGVFYDHFKLVYAYFNKGDKFCECYSCLKFMIQTLLHVSFLTIFFYKTYNLNDSLDIWNLCNLILFLNKEIIRSILQLRFLHETFYNFQFKNYNYNSNPSDFFM